MIPLYHRVPDSPGDAHAQRHRDHARASSSLPPSSSKSRWWPTSSILSKPLRRRGAWTQLLFLGVLGCLGWMMWRRSEAGVRIGVGYEHGYDGDDGDDNGEEGKIGACIPRFDACNN